VAFDDATLAALRTKGGSDEETVINLSRSLLPSERETAPHLVSIAERAAAVMQALDDRQASTHQALEQLAALAKERNAAEAARKESGLGSPAFSVFWELKREGYPEVQAKDLAAEIEMAYSRFPNSGANADEERQLKAEIYKVLLRIVGGRKMVELADRIMAARKEA